MRVELYSPARVHVVLELAKAKTLRQPQRQPTHYSTDTVGNGSSLGDIYGAGFVMERWDRLVSAPQLMTVSST